MVASGMGLKHDIPSLAWDAHLASRTESMKGSMIRELLKLIQQPDIISFAGGLPAPEFFPTREIEEACCRVMREEGAAALQYSATEGYGPLKEFLANMLQGYGIQAAPANFLLTNGSQQALDLIGKIFLDPGDYVITGRPTYLGAIQAWNAYQARYQTVALDDEGMVTDEIERAYEAALEESGNPPKFIYVLPNFHNPAGTTLSRERRERLSELAAELALLVVEDDPYGQLRYEGEHLPSIYAHIPGRTVYVGTFSKILAPGLRLGWIVCSDALMTRFVEAKQGADLHTGTFVQYVVNAVCQQGFLACIMEVTRISN